MITPEIWAVIIVCVTLIIITLIICNTIESIKDNKMSHIIGGSLNALQTILNYRLVEKETNAPVG